MKYTPEATALADAILRASGSNLKNYTMKSSLDAIVGAAQTALDTASRRLLDAAIEGRNSCQILANECQEQDDTNHAGIWQRKADKCAAAIISVTGAA